MLLKYESLELEEEYFFQLLRFQFSEMTPFFSEISEKSTPIDWGHWCGLKKNVMDKSYFITEKLYSNRIKNHSRVRLFEYPRLLYPGRAFNVIWFVSARGNLFISQITDDRSRREKIRAWIYCPQSKIVVHGGQLQMNCNRYEHGFKWILRSDSYW